MDYFLFILLVSLLVLQLYKVNLQPYLQGYLLIPEAMLQITNSLLWSYFVFMFFENN